MAKKRSHKSRQQKRKHQHPTGSGEFRLPEVKADADSLKHWVTKAIASQQFDEGIRLLTKAIEEGQTHWAIYECMGRLYIAKGEARVNGEKAVYWLEKARTLKPRSPRILVPLGHSLLKLGKIDEAGEVFSKALKIDPTAEDARWPLADILIRQKRPDEAIELVREIADAEPNNANALIVMGQVYKRLSQFANALEWYKKYVEVHPDAMGYNELSGCYNRLGLFAESEDAIRKAIEHMPTEPRLTGNLASLLMDMGRADEALEMAEKALNLGPQYTDLASNYLLFLHYQSTLDRRELYEKHKRLGRRFLSAGWDSKQYTNLPDPNRRLRIGFISPDFKRHSVAYFLEPILDARDPSQVEIFAYSHVGSPDEVTERLKSKVDHYRLIYGMEYTDMARLIESDQIDILVELAGHTGSSMLRVMGQKPAPIQVSYLGYPDTTGVPSIDYRLSDETADPPGSEAFCVEHLVNLTGGFLCYKPAVDLAPQVGPMPCKSSGHITFGSFNNSRKITPLVISLWAEVLRLVENSRLLLKFKGGNDPQIRDFYLAEFEKVGIDPSRIIICKPTLPHEHFEMYNMVDIALDTYPYHGTTTTCEALWMGVPVITLVGDHHASRVGLSILKQVGLEFFAAESPEEYISKAVALAGNDESREKIRQTMRQRMAESDLCNDTFFARKIEAAFRLMWQHWCRQQQQAGEEDLTLGDLSGEGGLTLGDLSGNAPTIEQQLKQDAAAEEQEQYQKAVDLFQTNHLDEAISAFARLTRDYPNEPVFWNDLGVACFTAGRQSEGLGHIEHALELASDDAGIMENLAELSRQAGQWDRAMELYMQIFDQHPNPQSMIALAEGFAAAGHADQAAVILQRTLQEDPENEEAKQLLDEVSEAVKH